ncbi:MAG: hypothetical protein R2685_03665 [Candidatus Nitrosocosmicus sp.]|nr:hypothetical protein [Candidatus Nitrosocosmicus sp.]
MVKIRSKIFRNNEVQALVQENRQLIKSKWKLIPDPIVWTWEEIRYNQHEINNLRKILNSRILKMNKNWLKNADNSDLFDCNINKSISHEKYAHVMIKNLRQNNNSGKLNYCQSEGL